MSGWPVARKTAIGFVGTLAIVLIAIGAAYWTTSASQNSAASIARSVDYIAGQERVYSQLLALLWNQRGYMANGSSTDLAARNVARTELDREMAALVRDTARASPDQQARVKRLSGALDEELSLLDNGLAARTGQLPTPPASEEVRLRARELIGTIRTTLDELQAAQRSEITQRLDTDRKSAHALFEVLILIAIAGIIGIALFLVHVLRDLGARDLVASQLAETNQYLESLVANVPAMIFAKDARDLKFVQFNDAGEQLLGIAKTELLGKSDRDFFPPDQANFFVEKDREVLRGNATIDIPAEEIDTRTHGRRILHTRKVPVRDARGEPRMLLGISMDITEQKRAEQDVLKLNAELKHNADLLAAANQDLEGFCYSVSHDLRAPLRAIDGFARLLEENIRHTVSTEAQRHLRTIRANTERMAQLIDDLLEFSRLGRQPLSSAAVDMSQLARRVIEEVSQGRPGPAPRVDVGTLPPARGDARALHHVWLNLIDNAVKYSSGASAPWITVVGEDKGDEVVYSVRDNGIGFDMQYYDKLFGVFQRLHSAEEFPGTGVGLAIVQRIVARHGGRVWADSTPGKGAAFSFALPQTGGSTTKH